MTWRKINTDLIPWSDYVEEVLYPDGDTDDIIAGFLEGDSEHDTRFHDFAKQFSKDKEGLKLLWSFTKKAIVYKEDGFNVQDIKLAAALWVIGKGDCKSKTLFINQILKCLKIPYITRFVGYEKGSITHVYSIAYLNGNPIIMDSVYHYFNAEPRHKETKDFDMTKVSIIRGLRNNIATTEGADLYHQVTQEAKDRYEEIQQRKQYVQPEPPINFAEVSEGTALLKLLERKLKIIGTMQDEQKATTEKGINLIRRTIETGKISGIIPDDLQGTARRINHYLSLNGSAIGHGYRGNALKFHKQKARKAAKIGTVPGGGVPGMECLTNLWWHTNGGSGTTLDPYLYATYNNGLSILGNAACGSRTFQDFAQNGNLIYFFYGRNSKFRVDYSQGRSYFNGILRDFERANGNLINEVMHGQYFFQSQAAYDALIEELKQGMPVLSNWANDLFRADNTRPDGTVGTGLLYNFIPDLTQIAAISPSNFPAVAQTKMVFQRQYIDSCVNFSTISRNIFSDMSENGILFDNGGQTPERILSALLLRHNPQVGELTAIAAGLIIGIVTAVLSSIPAIVSAANQGAANAALIDSAGTNTNPFNNQSPSTMPNMSDFPPLVQTGGGSGGGGNNNNKKESSLLPFALGAGLLYAGSKYRKNKK